MSDADRRRAFAIAAAFIVTAVVVVGLFDGPHHRSPVTSASRPATSQRGIVVTAAPHAARKPAPTSIGTAADQRAVLVTAHAFAAAFVRYEVGRLTPSVKAQLRGSATAAFASQLLGAPPSTPPGTASPRPATVVSVAPSAAPGAGSATVAVTLSRDGRLDPLTLALTKSSTGWLVSALR
jgi:hypothetical protein